VLFEGGQKRAEALLGFGIVLRPAHEAETAVAVRLDQVFDGFGQSRLVVRKNRGSPGKLHGHRAQGQVPQGVQEALPLSFRLRLDAGCQHDDPIDAFASQEPSGSADPIPGPTGQALGEAGDADIALTGRLEDAFEHLSLVLGRQPIRE
jgi:hypothetical protein